MHLEASISTPTKVRLIHKFTGLLYNRGDPEVVLNKSSLQPCPETGFG